jgi:hypothetical protein
MSIYRRFLTGLFMNKTREYSVAPPPFSIATVASLMGQLRLKYASALVIKHNATWNAAYG